MYVLPQDQGQTVEVSYGIGGGYAWRRILDRSDREETWYRCPSDLLPEGYDWDDESMAPPVPGWEECMAPEGGDDE